MRPQIIVVRQPPQHRLAWFWLRTMLVFASTTSLWQLGHATSNPRVLIFVGWPMVAILLAVAWPAGCWLWRRCRG